MRGTYLALGWTVVALSVAACMPQTVVAQNDLFDTFDEPQPTPAAEPADDPFGNPNDDNPFGQFEADDPFDGPGRGRTVAAEPSLDTVLDQAVGADAGTVRPNRTLVADPPMAGTNGAPPCHCADDSDSATTARINRVLDEPLTRTGFDFPGTAIEEIVDFIQEEYNIPVQIDAKALDDVGIGSDEPVTINVRNTSLRSGLRLMLDQLDLTYVIRNEVLMITTPEVAECELRTCVYNVRDLVANPQRSHAFDSLIDTLVATVATETWAENGGGDAEIRTFNSGMLVISQTQAVHDEIAGLLAAIRRAGGELPVDAGQAAVDSEPEVVTRSYTLNVDEKSNLERVGERAVQMIRAVVPDANASAIGDEACWIDHISGRIVVRHSLDVHDKIAALLVESKLTNSQREFGGSIGGGVFRRDVD